MAEIDITLKLEVEQLASRLKAIQGQLKEVGEQGEKAGKKASTGLDNITNKGVEQFKKLGAAVAGAFAVGAVVAFGKECVSAFMEAEKSAAKLKFAVDKIAGQGGSFDRLLKQSSELQKNSIFDDESIQAAQTAALQYGMSAEQVEKLLPLIVDLASATGTDLASAMDTIIRGTEGQMRGLKTLGIAFKDTGDKSQNLSIIMDKLGKFSGSAGVSLNTAGGQVEHLKNQFGDTQEVIGQFLFNAFAPLIKSTNKFVQGLNEVAQAPSMADNLREEQAQLNVLVHSITSLNVKNDARRMLIKELSDKYPEFYGKIKNEVNNNEALRKKLAEVNEEYLKKIRIAAAQDELKKMDEESVKIAKEQLKAILAINESYDNYAKKVADSYDLRIKLAGKDSDEGKRLEQEKQDFLNKSISLEDKLAIIRSENAAGLTKDFTKQNNLLGALVNSATFDNAIKKLAELDKQRQALLSVVPEAAITPANKDLGPTLTGEGDAKAKLEKEFKDVNAIFEELLKRDSAHQEALIDETITNLKNKEYKPIDVDQLINDYADATNTIDDYYKKQIDNAEILGEDTQAIRDKWAKESTATEKWLQDWLIKFDKEANDTLLKNEQDYKDGLEQIDKEIDTNINDRIEKRKQALAQFTDQIKESIGILLAQNVEVATKNAELYNQQIADQEAALQKQKDLEEKGYSNSVSLEQKKLKDLQAKRDAALEEQKKAARLQLAFETAQQAAGIATSVVNLFKMWSALGPLGYLGAVAQVASLFALITQYKAKAASISKMADGGLLSGPSHLNGGIPILGTGIEVEGGEYVMNKRSTARFLPLLEALNNGKGVPEYYTGKMNHSVSLEESKTLKAIEQNTKRMLNGTQITYGNGYYIEKTGNKTRKVYTS